MLGGYAWQADLGVGTSGVWGIGSMGKGLSWLEILWRGRQVEHENGVSIGGKAPATVGVDVKVWVGVGWGGGGGAFLLIVGALQLMTGPSRCIGGTRGRDGRSYHGTACAFGNGRLGVHHVVGKTSEQDCWG